MSDERFERDIADALLVDDPGDVPGRLKARLAVIPDGAARRGARPMRAVGLLAAAAVVILAIGVAGLSHRGETVGPPASAGASGTIPGGTLVDRATAVDLALAFYAGAHGDGPKLSDVKAGEVTEVVDAAHAAWRVQVSATVTESTEISYGSVMWLDVDESSGKVTVFAQG